MIVAGSQFLHDFVYFNPISFCNFNTESTYLIWKKMMLMHVCGKVPLFCNFVSQKKKKNKRPRGKRVMSVASDVSCITTLLQETFQSTLVRAWERFGCKVDSTVCKRQTCSRSSRSNIAQHMRKWFKSRLTVSLGRSTTNSLAVGCCIKGFVNLYAWLAFLGLGFLGKKITDSKHMGLIFMQSFYSTVCIWGKCKLFSFFSFFFFFVSLPMLSLFFIIMKNLWVYSSHSGLRLSVISKVVVICCWK